MTRLNMRTVQLQSYTVGRSNLKTHNILLYEYVGEEEQSVSSITTYTPKEIPFKVDFYCTALVFAIQRMYFRQMESLERLL